MPPFGSSCCKTLPRLVIVAGRFAGSDRDTTSERRLVRLGSFLLYIAILPAYPASPSALHKVSRHHLSPSFMRADASACRIWKNLTAPPSRARRFPSNNQSTVISILFHLLSWCCGLSALGYRADKPATPLQKVE